MKKLIVVALAVLALCAVAAPAMATPNGLIWPNSTMRYVP